MFLMTSFAFQPFPKKTTDDFADRLQALLDRQRASIDTLSQSAPVTYKAILKPLQDLDEELELFFTPLAHLNSVCNSPQTQEAYEAAIPLLSTFESERTQNKALFEKIEAITANTPDATAVTRHTVRDFVLAGARLDVEDKARIQAIDLRLSELSNAFSQNLLEIEKYI
jgi:oligopeptidase A